MRKNNKRDILLDTKDVLKQMGRRAVVHTVLDEGVANKLKDILEKDGGRRWNTYNWGAPLVNHLEGFTYYHVGKDGFNDYMLIICSMHIGVDIRAGYTPDELFIFEGSDDYIEAICDAEGMNTRDIWVWDKIYFVCPHLDEEGLEIMDHLHNSLFYIYPDDYTEEEVAACIEEELEKEK